MKKMKKTAILMFLLLTMTLHLQAREWNREQVADAITRVNAYWQKNNKAEVRSFWDNAAYHTGNMEV